MDVQLTIYFETNPAIARLVVSQHSDQTKGFFVARRAETLHHGSIFHKAVVVHLIGNPYNTFNPLIHSVLWILQMCRHKLAKCLCSTWIKRLLQEFSFLFLLLKFFHSDPNILTGRKYTFSIHNSPFSNHCSLCDRRNGKSHTSSAIQNRYIPCTLTSVLCGLSM